MCTSILPLDGGASYAREQGEAQGCPRSWAEGLLHQVQESSSSSAPRSPRFTHLTLNLPHLGLFQLGRVFMWSLRESPLGEF